ncbi:MAG TPA: bacillithiol biosynthesis cysteine-adding enzyme BshC [Pyrinomonadaceae bacterium]|nr:bacillithiol biosynthesis cysteine-adding enzyme BshC [Pyrinomonadaceae bacterium]
MSTTEPACEGAPEAAGLRVESLPFAREPHQSRLFLEYLRDPVSLRRFYPRAVGSHQDVAGLAPEVLAAPHAERDAVCDALADSNRFWNAGEETLSNVARLRAGEAVAVVTGQQVGLFTGPLYTIYKALSAVKLARCLTQRGVEAVPVFWMATEDHDWEEVRRVEFTACDGRLASAGVSGELHREGLPVGGVTLTDEVEGALARLSELLPTTEFTPDLEALLRDAYRPGRTFGEAFARTLAALTEPFGLVLLDPSDPSLKKLAAPLYAEAARRAPDIAAAVEARSRVLEEEGFHAQVFASADSFPLFWHDDEGARRAITRATDGRYVVKDATRTHAHTADEWADRAGRHPERFSPNVTLRAVVQDYLLPTVAYFGGAAEVAYFAQTAEVYRLLSRPATTILHRASFTFVERRTGRALERYQLHLTDFFEGLDAVVARVVDEHLGADTARAFGDAEANIQRSLDGLQEHLRGFDPTLADALTTGRRKIQHQLDGLRTRFRRAQMQRDRAAMRQLERAAATLYPEESLQERHLNFASFHARHGRYFLDWAYSAIDLGSVDHRIVYL